MLNRNAIHKPAFLIALFFVCVSLCGNALAESSKATEKGSEFLRFIDKGGDGSRIETSIVRYKNSDGAQVDLIAAVHVADRQYYEELNRRFEAYDALLYELIKDEGLEQLDRNEAGTSMISVMQRGMKNVLELDFQLDAVDYSKKNFVHADMSSEMFSRMQRDKGESVLTFLLKSMMAGWEQQLEGNAPQMSLLHLIAAFASKDRALTLKYILGREFGQMEAMMVGLDETKDGEGSVILSGRNKIAIQVLRKELKKGKKKLGVFYGAGHMPGLEELLFELGFQKQTVEWLTAWDIRAKPEIGTPSDNAPDAEDKDSQN